MKKNSYRELKKAATGIEKTKIKVSKTAKDLKLTSKQKGEVRVKIHKTSKKLKKTASEIGKSRVKVAKAAEDIKVATEKSEEISATLSKGTAKLKKVVKKKEKKLFKLAEIAKQLAKTADIKEVVRVRMAKKAEILKKSAMEKEKVRIELAKTAATIKELSDRNEAILSSIGDAAFACDKDGNIIIFNKMAVEITNIAKRDALGVHYNKLIKFVSEKTGKPVDDFILRAMKEKIKTEMEPNTLLVRRDGREVPVADTAAPIFDSSGSVTGCVVVFRDVTKERSIDRAKTEFVSLSSHQLRSPLTAIGWYVELLQSETNGALTSKQLKLTQDILDAHKRMTTLINALLNVSRIEMGTFPIDPLPTNIRVVLKNTLELFKHQINEKKLKLIEKYDDDLDNFIADPKILGIIFQNLISNSVKYTPSGGTIQIKITKRKNLEISVSDTGMGIPKEQQAKIFSKLFRADNASKADPEGTGLGLYIISEIVKTSGGTIRFESEVGEKTTFYVSYPLSGMSQKVGDKGLL